MKIFLFCLLTLFFLEAEPLKVPQEFYSGHGPCQASVAHGQLFTDINLRSISDHIIDQKTEWFDPELVQQGDIVYLNVWYMEWFEKFVHDAIRHPYLLITYDVGDWLPHPDFKRLCYDPKLAAWFCRNLLFSYHPRLIQIPMGQNDRYFSDTPLAHLNALLTKLPLEKHYFLYMNYLPRAWGDRDKIQMLFEDEPYCFSRNHSGREYHSIAREQYFEELAASHFVISPIGLETDCVRTWEALALDCIPIVEHTFLDPLFEELPVLMIHEWNEIDEPFLKEKEELLRRKKKDKAFFGPWRQLILETQKKVRGGDLAFSFLEATQFAPQDLRDLVALLEGNTHLIYCGFLSGIHALELANAAPFLSKIQLCDPWLDQKTFRSFAAYLKDLELLKNQKKIALIPFKLFDSVFASSSKNSHPIFLDFSFYRNSLMRDQTLKHFRHSLKKDLTDLYLAASLGALICGNQAHNSYVKEVLEQFCREQQRTIEIRNDLWFFRKD